MSQSERWRKPAVDEFAAAEDLETSLEQEESDVVDVDEAVFLARIDEVLASESRGKS